MRKLRLFNSITGRLLPAFLIAALIPTVFLSVSVYYSAQKSALSISQNLISEQFSMVDSLIDQLIISSAVELSVVRTHAGFKRFLKERDSRTLDQEFTSIMQRHPEFLQVKYIDKSGMELARLTRTSKGLLWARQNELHDRSDKYYFRQAMHLSGSYIYVSGLDPNLDKGLAGYPQRLVARLGIQVMGDSGVKGILLINLDGNYIFRRILPLSSAKPGKAMLINSNGTYISYNGTTFREADHKEFYNKFGIRVFSILKDSQISQKRVKNGYISVLPIRFDYTEGANTWHVAIFESDKEIHSAVLSTMEPYLLSLIVIFAGILIFTMLVSGSIIRKVRHLVSFIPKASDDEYIETGISEFDGMGHAIRTMAKKLKKSTMELAELNTGLETRIAEQVEKIAGMTEKELEYQKQLRDIQAQLMHADRLASLGMISAAMAHEIGNPLAAMKTSLEVLRADIQAEEEKEFITMIISQVDRLAAFLRSITKFGAKKDTELKYVNMTEIISEVIQSLINEAQNNHVDFSVNTDDRCSVFYDEIQVRQVVFNIIMNSIQELKELDGGTIYISTEKQDGQCLLKIYDTGRGGRDTDKMFDPFYTTKKEGTGLGLAIVHDIIKSAGWQIKAENKEGAGLMITITMTGGNHER